MSEVITIPYAVYESQQERSDRSNKRLFILTVILIIALLGTNIGWIVYESQFEYVEEKTVTEISVSQEADEGGDNIFIGGDGEVNAKTDSKD